MSLEQATTDILSAQIEGIKGEDWINQKTIENLKEFCYIDDEFQSRGMVLTAESEEYISSVGSSVWDTVSVAYGESGIKEEYYYDYLHYLYKNQMVFNDIYSTGGEKEVVDKVVKAYLEENLDRIRGFQIAKVNDDGTPATPEQIEKLLEFTNEAVEEVNHGADMVTTAGKYMPMVGEFLGSTVDFSDGSQYTLDTFLNRTNGNVDPDFAAQVQSLKNYQCAFYNTDQYYLIYQKFPAYTSDKEYAALKQTVINLLKNEEFKDFVQEQCKDMEVITDPAALKYYSPDKMKISY